MAENASAQNGNEGDDLNKLIIENKSDLSWEDVLIYVKVVIRQGMISETGKGKQYCFATQFKEPNVTVWTDRNKKSHRFVIENNS